MGFSTGGGDGGGLVVVGVLGPLMLGWVGGDAGLDKMERCTVFNTSSFGKKAKGQRCSNRWKYRPVERSVVRTVVWSDSG